VNLSINVVRFSLVTILLSLGFGASADVIDSFTAQQGPYSVGPGEEIAEEDATIFSSSVLGDFRVMVPGVDEDAEPGSKAEFEIGGGLFRCEVEFPSDNNPNNSGACAGGYDRSDGPVFDLTGSSEFQFDVQSVVGNISIGVTLTDTNENVSLGFIQNVTPGLRTIPFNQMISPTTQADLELIDNIGWTVLSQGGQEGSITIGEFSTDGPIGIGPVIPTDSDVDPFEIPGTYSDPLRDGEGCQLTLERDGVTFILTCYFYDDGEQFWIIGIGVLSGNHITFVDMTITSGADYGNAFDTSDVIRETFGSGYMEWSDCNNAELTLMPVLSGFEQVKLTLTRILPAICGGGGVVGEVLPWMGAYFNPNRDGEGFHFGVEVGGYFVMTWYTYFNGKQIWLIASGTRNGLRVEFNNVIITSGANFGSEFDPADVVRQTFGTIIVDITDCNHFTATVNSVLPEFQNLVLDVEKIVPGVCP